MSAFRKQLALQADRIEAVLTLHNVVARITGGTVTPRWVRFQALPAIGVKISKIKNLSEEFAAALDVPTCRVARRGAAVAIEVPRDDPRTVRLLPLLAQCQDSVAPIPPVTATLGLADDGAPLLIRLPSPNVAHVLIAGTTGSGKTALLQTMILSLAVTNSPSSVTLILIDPKGSAFAPFRCLPHLARPVIRDVEEMTEALRSLVRLMERRGVKPQGQPHTAVFIDELADILLVGGDPVHRALTRLIQRGREAGIHIVAAAQKPTAAVLGPLVKANFPVRLVGRVTSIEDARVASGWSGTGAERLLGQGDFLAVAEGRVIRFQSAYVSEEEIAAEMDERGWTTPRPEPVDGPPRWDARRGAAPLRPSPPQDAVQVMVTRLRAMGWDPGSSYRDACRRLGEAEGGRRFYLVQQAVDHLRADLRSAKGATATASTNAPGPRTAIPRLSWR